MHSSDRQLAAFLAGELDPGAARSLDEHLLECEDCWHAVCAARLGRRAAARLSEPTPPALADRIRLAIELAPSTAPPKRRRRQRGRWAVAAGTAALIAAAVLATFALPRQTPRRDPAVITALVHLAAQPAAARPGEVDTELAGQAVVLLHYPVEGGTALVATSTQAFPTPPGARLRPGAAMAWTIMRDTVTLYCPHSQVILAGSVPASALATLARRLHLDR
jgi:hypothetical protein